jgi:signal transduction histidine kinase
MSPGSLFARLRPAGRGAGLFGGLGLRSRLLLAFFLITGVSLGLVTGQAILLFQEDKTAYVFDLNASQAIKIADEIQANVRHLTEKMRIFSEAVRLPLPEGTDRRPMLSGMLRQYPEFLLCSLREQDGTMKNVFLSGTLQRLGLTVDQVHAAYAGAGLGFDRMTAERPLIARLDLSAKLASFTVAVRGAGSPVSPVPPAGGAPAGAPGAPAATGAPDAAPPEAPILVAEFPLNRLYGTTGQSRLFEIYVTDASGRALVGGASGAAGAAPAAAGAVTPAAGAATPASFAGLLPQTAATAGTREYLLDGVPMLAAYAPVGDLGLWTVVQIPKARAFEAARRLIARSILIAGVVCAAALGLALLFATGLTRSLKALMRATEQIGQGHFKVEVGVRGGGEIGALAERFRRMTDELSAREEALKDANRRLVESEKMTAIGQLGAGIAHEVKNPMTSIRGYAQLGMRRVAPDNPLHEYFATIEKETGRSLEILKNLLRFSRQETAEMSLIDLNAVVTDAVKLCSHQLGMKGIEVSADLHEEPLQVMGNANQVEQVLLNLMMNAGDAMENGGGKIVVTTDTAGVSARLRVADTGGGIPAEALGRIFEPFFTTKPVGKGTGLGLSVSYGIVKDHKGEISVQSKVGQGTAFTILIPLVRQAAAEQSKPAEEKRVRVINLR